MNNIVRRKKYFIFLFLLLFSLAPTFCFAQEDSSSKILEYFKHPLKIFESFTDKERLNKVIESPQKATDYLMDETKIGSQLNPQAISETIKKEIKKEVDRQVQIQKEKIKTKAWNMFKGIIKEIVDGFIKSIEEIFKNFGEKN